MYYVVEYGIVVYWKYKEIGYSNINVNIMIEDEKFIWFR